jgi:DNA recombination protein RmuC
MDMTSVLLGLAGGLLVGLIIGAVAGGWAVAALRRSIEPVADQLPEGPSLVEPVLPTVQDVHEMVRPVAETLQRVEKQLADSERVRMQAHGELREQVHTMGRTSDLLRTETQALVAALRKPQVRGRWGEMQLRRVVEVAGLVEHCDFDEQVSMRTDDGRLRPDLVVRLAGGKNVVVDAKVPYAGYIDAMNTQDDAVAAERLAAHARHMRAHVDDLSRKSYWETLTPTPEFVVLFVPAEPFLSAALEQDAGLLEYAFERNVVIATPNTLVAMLRTVAYTWRQEALTQNAQQVLTLGRDLHQRLGTMGGYLTKLGNSLETAVKSFNQSVASLEGRVFVAARRFNDLKVADQELVAPAQIDLAPRMPQAPELVQSLEPQIDLLGDETNDTPRRAAG